MSSDERELSPQHPVRQQDSTKTLSQDFFRSAVPRSEPPRIGLHYLLDVARRRWWLAFIVSIPFIVATVVYTNFAAKVYESESTFLLEATGDRGSSALSLLDRIGRVSRLENEMALIQSRRVLGPTVDRLDLHATLFVDGVATRPAEVLEAFDATDEAIPGQYAIVPFGDSARFVDMVTREDLARWSPGDTVRLPGLTFVAPANPAGAVELLIDDFNSTQNGLGGAIAVSRLGREADLVQLKCKAADPQMAFAICSGISESYLGLRNELQVSEAANARDFLTDATGRIKEQLTEAEDSLADYTERYSAVALDTRADAEVRNISDLEARRDARITERTALRRFLAGIEGGGSGTARYRELASFPTFLENDAITQLVASLIALDNRRSDLAMLRSDENSEMAAINGRIADIERQLQGMARSYEQALTLQIESLSETLATASQRIAGGPTRQVELVRRERQVEQLEEMYGALEGRLREAELAAGVGMPNVRPIDPPQVPLRPASPSVAMNIALGTTLGLAMGLLFAAFREATDSRVRDRRAVEAAAGLRVVGMLPTVSEPVPLLTEEVTRAVGILTRAGKSLGWSPGSAGEKEWQPAVESFRTLAADLRIAMAGSNGSGPPKSIAVMSSAQGEGKTYTTSNLALVWASMGARTLLVDADLRMGRVSRFLGLPSEANGLADILRAEVHPTDACRTVSVRGGHQLHVVTAGRTSGYGIEAFRIEERIDDVVTFYENEYDIVFIDTPPLNVVSESAIIAAAADAVLFVVRSGYTRPESLEVALQRLQRSNGNLLGIVMNDTALPSYYSSYYGSKSSG